MIVKETIPFSSIPLYSSLVADYLNDVDVLRPLHEGLPTPDRISEKAKKRSFPSEKRKTLSDALTRQYQRGGVNPPNLLGQLSDKNTVTVTTGHQLCLFAGPLYFIYKITHTIRLAEEMNRRDDGMHYVPVFWMATEDHDFEEINHCHVFGKKITWERDFGGAVGRMATESVEPIVTQMSEILGDSENAQHLSRLFQQTYAASNLADATRMLVASLFGDKIIVIDGDDRVLKEEFIPYAKKELLMQLTYESASNTNKLLEETYHNQVYTRKTNLFLLSEGKRERLEIQENGLYRAIDSGEEWTKEEIVKLLEEAPERFSPNALLRPLYQEVVLPNVVYIGGGGEIAYWLQLKDTFSAFQTDFPLLMLRASILWMEERSAQKLQNHNLGVEDLFVGEEEWHKILVKALPEEASVDLTQDRVAAEVFFKGLAGKAAQTDGSLGPAVEAEGAKVNAFLDKLEKRLITGEKKKHEILINQLNAIRAKVLPNGVLQERHDNFSNLYLKLGNGFFNRVYKELDVFGNELQVIYY